MKRHSPLKRKAELIRGAPLRNRGTKARRDAVEMAEAERDMGSKVCAVLVAFNTPPGNLRGEPHVCWGQLQRHHVLMRSHGGTNHHTNLIWVCAGGHQWIHGHPRAAREMGLLR